MDLTPKQQTSEAIRQAETILITTGQHPSVDQVAAVISLAAILRKFGKKVSAVISDSLPQSVQLLDTATVDRSMAGLRDFVLKLDMSKAEVDKLRYEVLDGKLHIFVTPFKGNFAPSDVTFDYGDAQYEYDLAIVLGVPTRARIDRVYDQNQAMFSKIPVVNLDFHRSNENYGAVNLIEPNASSLCEMLVALAESLQSGIIDADIATGLLMGIVGSTDRFMASHTTSKSLTVAAQMMAAGARQQAVVRALYRDGRNEQSRSNERPSERPSRDAPRAERQPQAERSQPERSSQAERPVQSAPVARPEPRTERRFEPAPARSEAPAQVAAVAPAAPVVEQRPVQQPASVVQPPTVPSPSQPAPMTMPVQPIQAPQPQPQSVLEVDDLPIIQPAHIELSELNENTPPAAEQVPSEVPPMADFAVAAEILARQRGEGSPQSEPSRL